MKSQSFTSLKALILSLGAQWDDTVMDVSPEKCPLFYGSEDEVFTEDTHRRRLNHDTPDHWLQRYNQRYYSKKHDCWLTMAHCMSGTKDRLIGDLCSEDEKIRILAWKEAHSDKIKANNARYSAKPEHKLKDKLAHQSLRDSEWKISHDIKLTIEYNDDRHKKPTVNTFKANTSYKWSQLQNYYKSSGGISTAIQDGWYRLSKSL